MATDGNWQRNPYNNLESLKQHALPKILFEECHKNCVELDFMAAKTESDLKCIKNCQNKTYQAFDMYMRVQYNFAKKQTWRDYVDLSNYAGMEVEHSHNTADLYEMSQSATPGKFSPHNTNATNFKAFTNKLDKNNATLKNVAFLWDRYSDHLYKDRVHLLLLDIEAPRSINI